MFKSLIWPLVKVFCFTAFAKGFLLYLDEVHKIYVDRWVAKVLGFIETTTVQAPEWVGWALVGSVGLMATGIWEAVKRRRYQHSLSEADETPEKNIPAPQKQVPPEFDVVFRFDDGFAEICVRNLLDNKILDDVVVAIPNVSESLELYEPQSVFVQLNSRDGSGFIHPKGQKYFRFARVIELDGEQGIEICSGESGVRQIRGPQCAVKFRVSARDTREKTYYIAATIDSAGELSLGQYKRRKKAASKPAQTTDFLHEIAALRTLETVLRNRPISTQSQFDNWEKQVSTARQEVARVINENISAAEAETYTTVGNLKYSAQGGFNEHHNRLLAILTRDIDYLQELIIHYSRAKN